MLKSTALEYIHQTCTAHSDKGYGSIYISDTTSIKNCLHLVYSKWGQSMDKDGNVVADNMIDHPYILIDLSRAFSGRLHEDSSCLGCVETLMSNFTSGKYQGGEVQWGMCKPTVVIVSNQRPISVCLESDGLTRKDDSKPICHLSAHRLIGNVYTIKQEANDYTLIQDTVCDRWALEIREWEMTAQAKMIVEIEESTAPTGKLLFDKFVLSQYEFDSDLATSEWVSYDYLYHQFHMVAPKARFKGPNNLLCKIREWYASELSEGTLKMKKVRREAGDESKVIKLSLRFKPDAHAIARDPE